MWPYGSDRHSEHKVTNTRIAFRKADSSDKTSTSQVEDVATVTMHFVDDTDVSVEQGHMFLAGQDDNQIHLAVSTDKTRNPLIRLTIRNSDWQFFFNAS